MRTGCLIGALTGQFRNPSGQGVTRAGSPLPRSFLHPSHPGAFFRLHPDQYRLQLVRGGETPDALRPFPPRRGRCRPFTSAFPRPSRRPSGIPAVLVLTADRPLRGVHEVTASCEGPAAPVASTQDDAEMRASSRPQAPFVCFGCRDPARVRPLRSGSKLGPAAQRGRETANHFSPISGSQRRACPGVASPPRRPPSAACTLLLAFLACLRRAPGGPRESSGRGRVEQPLERRPRGAGRRRRRGAPVVFAPRFGAGGGEPRRATRSRPRTPCPPR